MLPLLLDIVVEEGAREGLMNEILYEDKLSLTSKTMENLQKKIRKRKEAWESKGIKVNLG